MACEVMVPKVSQPSGIRVEFNPQPKWVEFRIVGEEGLMTLSCNLKSNLQPSHVHFPQNQTNQNSRAAVRM